MWTARANPIRTIDRIPHAEKHSAPGGRAADAPRSAALRGEPMTFAASQNLPHARSIAPWRSTARAWRVAAPAPAGRAARTEPALRGGCTAGLCWNRRRWRGCTWPRFGSARHRHWPSCSLPSGRRARTHRCRLRRPPARRPRRRSTPRMVTCSGLEDEVVRRFRGRGRPALCLWARGAPPPTDRHPRHAGRTGPACRVGRPGGGSAATPMLDFAGNVIRRGLHPPSPAGASGRVLGAAGRAARRPRRRAARRRARRCRRVRPPRGA